MSQQLAQSFVRSSRPAPARRPGPAKVVSQPRVPVAQPEQRALVRRAPAEVSKLQSQVVDPRAALRPIEQQGNRSLASQRGYAKTDLMAIAEIGYHYLLSGGTQLALTIFEGLCAVAPNEAYFALALGLTHDHLGDDRLALEWYRRAGALDPSDPRPDVNAAELYLARRDFASGVKLLERAVTKARHLGDEAIEKKASALITHIRRRAA
ncbi:MAG: hypothetical protein IPG45_30690 [Deltaproteobacteria bacterium]|jgi:tetratricopeptide (TPR) repeat protein|nr:hypothetical protein [Deltaproteobacteria bacterium]